MKFEKRIINPILKVIKENQEYLTKKENLPQLAKLGYMYNTLWYAGRLASYENIIEKDQCDDNPKYKIEICDPLNEEIENYIYDAWGMHVDNGYGPSYNEFYTIVTKGKKLSLVEQKLMKPNKTFDEWVEVLTDDNYKYSTIYQTKRAVADHLLCCIGTGYGFKNGFIIKEASGADQDESDYGDWMNSKFSDKIEKVVNKIMSDPDVKKILIHQEIKKANWIKEEEEKEIKAFGIPYKQYLKSFEYKKLFQGRQYSPYYPICNYSIITQLTKHSDPSYIQAGIEICKEILEHREEESKRLGNVEFAEKFLKTFDIYENKERKHISTSPGETV